MDPHYRPLGCLKSLEPPDQLFLVQLSLDVNSKVN